MEKPVLDVIIGSMKADIVDRKWDTQGSVSMKEVAILDYITTGKLYGSGSFLSMESDGSFLMYNTYCIVGNFHMVQSFVYFV